MKKFLKVPTHIAFIMDGNRRWAKRHGLPKALGHKHGAMALEKIVDELLKIDGIKYASFFGFSTENWNREKSEIDDIFKICKEMLVGNKEKFLQKNIKFVVMGDLSRFSQDFQDTVIDIMEKTKNNTALVVNLALNYGGRADIVHAVNQAIEKGQKIDEQTISQNLYSAPSPDVDLLIRTSGEMRVSNFMLYQMAYAEFCFVKKHWPDFDKKQLFKALKIFSKRNRRFGGQ